MSGNAGFNRLCRSLKNLGSIQQNERLWTEDGRIERYQTWVYLQGVVRKYYGQTKNENVRTVKEVVEQALGVLDMCTKNELLYQRMPAEEARTMFTSPALDRRRNYRRAQKLKELLRSSILGMHNLGNSTYSDDKRVSDEIDTLCEEINEKIYEVDVQCWRNVSEDDILSLPNIDDPQLPTDEEEEDLLEPPEVPEPTTQSKKQRQKHSMQPYTN